MGEQRRHEIAVIPGDGIGTEVTPAALEVLAAAGRAHGFELGPPSTTGAATTTRQTGAMMPEDALDRLAGATRSSWARSAATTCPTTCRCGAC